MVGSGFHGIRPGEVSEVRRWSTGELAGELPPRSLLFPSIRAAKTFRVS